MKKLTINDSDAFYHKFDGRIMTTYARFILNKKVYYYAMVTIYKSGQGGAVESIGEWYPITQDDYDSK